MVGECKRAAVSKAESTPATSCVSQQTGGYSGVHEPKRWPETAPTTVGCGGSIEEVYLQLIPSRCTKKQKQKQKPPIKKQSFPEDPREGTCFAHFSCQNQESQMKPPIKTQSFPEDLREGTRFAHFSCQNQKS